MKLIPSYIEESSPPGERVVFSSFQRSTKNWVVFHSLDLAPYNRNRRTELDFVAIIPEKGIFCIEVKSQENISFDSDRWQPQSIKSSPFKQSLNARFALHRRLKDRFGGRFSRLPVLQCCIFPRSDFDLGSSASILPSELMDRRGYQSCKTDDEFCKKLSDMFTKSVYNDPDITPLTKALTEEEIANLIDFFSPVRKRKPEKRQEICARQNELEQKLVAQQKPVLNIVELNNRVLVEGGAGTGKTLIGLEVAKRKAEQGLRVWFVCFNKTIGKWVESQASSLEQPNLVTGSVYSVLLNMMDINVPEDADNVWWSQTSLELIEEKLTDPDVAFEASFDYLVIDEAQDILSRPNLWNCLKLLMGGNIDGGAYLILGDFLNQALTNNLDCLEANLNELKGCSTRWSVSENCRNYRYIGDLALTLSAADKNTWTGYMRSGGAHDDWRLETYQDGVKQVESVGGYIQGARNSGFKDSEITILTFCTLKKSVIDGLVKSGIVLEPADIFGSPHVTYSTINRYKGMENKVIIITDVVLSPQDQDLQRKIFYTGMTRATERLLILCKESSGDVLKEWLL